MNPQIQGTHHTHTHTHHSETVGHQNQGQNFDNNPREMKITKKDY